MSIPVFFEFLLLPPAAYLLGSIPFGLIFTRIFVSIDIRKSGSRNIGATNVRRVAGNFWGILTLICDVLKGAVPVGLAVSLVGTETFRGQVFISMTALCAFSGHLYPVYWKFKGGGKGVATAGGCFLIISPFSLFVAILVFILALCLTRRVSAGSLTAMALLPLAVWKATGVPVFTVCAVVTGLMVWIRHIANIRRILSGTEPAAF